MQHYRNDRMVKRRFFLTKTNDGKLKVVDLWRIHHTEFCIGYNPFDIYEKYGLELEIEEVLCIKRVRNVG